MFGTKLFTMVLLLIFSIEQNFKIVGYAKPEYNKLSTYRIYKSNYITCVKNTAFH